MAKICLPIQRKSNKNLQLMEVKRGTTLWKIVYHTLVKLKINITPDPAVSFLGIFSRKMNCTCVPGYNNVHDSIAHNSPELETTPKVICNKMNK